MVFHFFVFEMVLVINTLYELESDLVGKPTKGNKVF